MTTLQFGCLALLFLGGCATHADLVLRGGRVHTLRADQPLVEAIAVRNGRIAALGSDDAMAPWIGAGTRVVELDGRPVVPGFADSHIHLTGLGRSLRILDLVGTASYGEVIARVAERAASEPAGTWILGRGWDQNDWPVHEFPHHAALSEAVGGHPVVLTRIDGHALLANAEAMGQAGVTAATVAPAGGIILRDDSGVPTGVFIDHAMDEVRRVLPAPSDELLRDGVRRAVDLLHRAGVTAVHDAGVSQDELERYASMVRAGEFDLRCYVMIAPEEYGRTGSQADEALQAAWWKPVADVAGAGRLVKRAVKLSADGALGSRGASLLEPYADAPGQRGLDLLSGDSIRSTAVKALRQGMQLCVHAIGDRANRTVLDAMEAALASVPPAQRAGSAAPAAHRFRIEHAQVLAPDDIPRFARLGVIPSMQAQHQTSDMAWAQDRLGPDRVRGAYAWRSLLDTGVIIPGGSDAPVERVDPLAAFHAAVTRSDAGGLPEGGWYAGQSMTRAEALAHLTLWPAIASFQEGRMGSLAPNMLADLVVLSEDLLTVPTVRLPDVHVDLTVFDGRVVYER